MLPASQESQLPNSIITGPILAGKLIDLTSRTSIWMFSAVFMLLAVLLMLQIRPRSTSQSPP